MFNLLLAVPHPIVRYKPNFDDEHFLETGRIIILLLDLFDAVSLYLYAY